MASSCVAAAMVASSSGGSLLIRLHRPRLACRAPATRATIIKPSCPSLKLPAIAARAAFSSLPAVAADISPPPSQPLQLLQSQQAEQNLNPFTRSLFPEGTQWCYSEFLNAVKKGKVERVRFSKDGTTLQLTAVDGRRANVTLPSDPDLVDILAANGVDISVSEGESNNSLFNILGNLLFPILAFGGLFLLFRRSQGGPGGPGGFGGPMDFGRSKSKFQEVPETGVTFAEVVGADQAKLELQEVVDFLKNPDKYTALGAKIPKGCLLVGPPGTGKTLLARAVSGEAGVPFFSCAASEFVELFVGVGASCVRDLFEKAKAKAPCIVFIDEIDAVGRQPGAGLVCGNDERERTINQLLTEMDGFTGNSGVIVLAATNRPDVLDSALLRPGRFDRQVTVDRPDVAGRVKILQQGISVSCTTRSTPSVDADDMEAFPDNEMDGSASANSCLIEKPWLTKLMLALTGREKPWMVPWTSFTIFQVMFLWFCTFWLVGSWIIPFAAHYAGCSKDTLTYRGQALYSLITDIAEGTVGLGILHRCLARFQPLPRNWFPFSWRGQWYIDVLLGCLTFPVVNRLSQLNLELLPFPSTLTSSYEQSIMGRDPIASVLYAIVVSVCCPIWEEVIFRGFLLPSLTRYLPMWASIFVSAVIFGLAHFNVQRMLPLTFLGLVMGIMFVRSRNLLSSMLLHSLWNGFVFMGLLR